MSTIVTPSVAPLAYTFMGHNFIANLAAVSVILIAAYAIMRQNTFADIAYIVTVAVCMRRKGVTFIIAAKGAANIMATFGDLIAIHDMANFAFAKITEFVTIRIYMVYAGILIMIIAIDTSLCVLEAISPVIIAIYMGLIGSIFIAAEATVKDMAFAAVFIIGRKMYNFAADIAYAIIVIICMIRLAAVIADAVAIVALAHSYPALVANAIFICIFMDFIPAVIAIAIVVFIHMGRFATVIANLFS